MHAEEEHVQYIWRHASWLSVRSGDSLLAVIGSAVRSADLLCCSLSVCHCTVSQ